MKISDSVTSARAGVPAAVLLFCLLFAGCGGGSGYGGGGGGNAPAAPTGLAATGGNAQVSLTWTASSGATGYYVDRSTTNGSGYTQIASPANTSYTDTGLANGTTYYYVVTAYNSYGTSGDSNQAFATPSAPPGAPTGLTATPGNAQVALTWNASSGASSYNVLRGTTSGGEASLATGVMSASYTDTAVTNGTTYYYEVSATNSVGTSPNSSQVFATPAGTTSVSVNVNVLANRRWISPYIYGGSFPECPQAITDSGLTVVRWGGNGSSEYNWTLGTTNADNDYYFEDFGWNAWSIGYPNPNCLGGLAAAPESDSVKWIGDVQGAGGYPLTTMAMLNWAAKSAETPTASGNHHWSYSVQKYTAQCKMDPYNSDAGDGILAANCSASNPPHILADPNDAYFPLLDNTSEPCPSWATLGCANAVYRSQWATALANAFANPAAGAPSCTAIPYFTVNSLPGGVSCHFYDMDNETDIWGGTHLDIHPNPSGYDELANTYLTEARNLRTWDASAVRLGPVSCCWWFYWNGANGGDRGAHGGVDFLPWWLNQVSWQDQIAGARSLDIFDVHAYPDASTPSTLAAQRALAVSIYRDYWDPTFSSPECQNEFQYATHMEPQNCVPFRIPRLRAWLNWVYPGTPLSITEWSAEFAGAADFSTAIGDADAYGILGRERVSLATRWTAPNSANPNYQALKLYTNYDGNHSRFAPISVQATNTGDPNLFSTYAATTSDGKTLMLMILDKDPGNADQVTFNLGGFTPATFTSYTLSQANPAKIVAGQANQAWSSTITFAPYTATLLVIGGTTASVPASEWDLNPDTIMVPAGGSATLQPRITSGTANVTLSSAAFDSYEGVPACSGGITLNTAAITPTQTGNITVPASNTPGFCHFTVTGSDGTATQTQSGWIVVGYAPVPLSRVSGNGQTGTHGSPLPNPLVANLNPAAGNAQGWKAAGASVLFSVDATSAANGATLTYTPSGGTPVTGPKVVAVTDSSGNASVTLTLPSTAGAVTVTAEGPYGMGHPTSAFTETSQ